MAGPNAILSLIVVALVPLTTSAGEWLQAHTEPTALIHRHAELGDTAIYAAVAVAVLAVLLWWRQREARGATPAKRTYLAPTSSAVTGLLATIALLASAGAIYDVVQIGDSGAKASWSDWAAQK